MSEVGHTPGPWLFRAKSNSFHVKDPTGERPYGPAFITITYDNDGSPDLQISEADLNLILAAPELLAAVKSLLFNRDSTSQVEILALIAKAEGK